MKFKVNTLAWYGVIFLPLFILALWLGLLFFVPPRNRDDWEGFIVSLLAVELLLFSCSPIAHRTVIVDENAITEKWLCFTFNRIELSKISDIGVCTHLSGNQVRQFVFASADKISDEEVVHFDSMGLFRRKAHKGRFIAIEHPQKGLDDCMKEIAEKNSLHYRHFSV